MKEKGCLQPIGDSPVIPQTPVLSLSSIASATLTCAARSFRVKVLLPNASTDLEIRRIIILFFNDMLSIRASVLG